MYSLVLRALRSLSTREERGVAPTLKKKRPPKTLIDIAAVIEFGGLGGLRGA